MPKIKYVCDLVISLSEIPSPNQYLIINVSFYKEALGDTVLKTSAL